MSFLPALGTTALLRSSAPVGILTAPETFPISPPTWFQHLDHGTFIHLSNSQDVPRFSAL